MPMKDGNPEIKAHQAVYGALKDLDSETTRRVLSSVLALLGMTESSISSAATPAATTAHEVRSASSASISSRPVSLIELMQDKGPKTNAERITLFAYYREKTEGFQRFERRDLEPYFAKAKLPPASNYGRDFVEAVKRGWIHEDGADSYLTSKGVEAVESGFAGEPKRRHAGTSAKSKGGKARSSKARKSSRKRSR